MSCVKVNVNTGLLACFLENVVKPSWKLPIPAPLTDSGDGDTNDTFTLTFTLLFKSLGDSDLTYNINIPNFLQK